MIEISDDEASTQFQSLLDRAEHGEVIVITRRGKAVAQLQPPEPGHDVEAARAAYGRIRERAKRLGIKATPEEIKSWIEEGRP
jgi:prevent-host-death family protein